jgi:hypothetical protein
MVAGLAGIWLAPSAISVSAAEPEKLQYSGSIGHIAKLPNGGLLSIYTVGRPHGEWDLSGPTQPAFSRYSSDDARTWSEPEVAYEYPSGRGTLPWMGQSQGLYLLVGAEGNIHAFALRYYYHHTPKLGDPRAPAYSELLHNVSRDGGKSWTTPRRIDFGHQYAGEIMSVIQLRSGRILLPLGYNTDNYIGERGEYERRITTVYSDDGGQTWAIGADNIKTPIGVWIGHTGAMEPVVVELKDGRVWMIIRTQTGRFYQAFSEDGGKTWSATSPTEIKQPNAPAGILRISDGRLILCWNDITEYPDEEIVRSGRQYLHIAVSGDEGKSWSRSKLIAWRRAGEPENTHVRYPFLCETGDGYVLVRYHRTGTKAPTRELLRVDPDWIAAR